MKRLRIAVFLLMVLGQLGCSRAVNSDPTKKLLADIEHYEAITATNPTNYAANNALSVLYTSYHLWLSTNSMDGAENYRTKALASTELALSESPNISSRVFLAMTFEELKEPKRALPIYKDFLAQVQMNKGEVPGIPEVDPRLRAKVQEELATLIADVKRRVRAIESR